MKVEIPAKTQHEGFYKITVVISDDCSTCGRPRGADRWRGFSYDGSRRMEVDCWRNACGHIDKYSAVRKEALQVQAMSEKYDCITFHTPACDEHQERIINVHGPDGLDDVCPICEIERLNELLSLPYPPNDGKTHWDNCWKDRGHHNCAVKKIERLEAIEKAAKVVIRDLDLLNLPLSCPDLRKALEGTSE